MELTLTAAAGRIDLSARMVTREDAEALAATLPKYVKAIASRLSGAPEHTGYFQVNVNLNPDKVTGDFNEAGVKRMTVAIAKLREQGHTINYVLRYTNSYPVEFVQDTFGY